MGERDEEWEAIIQWKGAELSLGSFNAHSPDAAIREARRRFTMVCVEARPSGVSRDYAHRETVVQNRDGFRTIIRAEKRSRVGPKGETKEHRKRKR